MAYDKLVDSAQLDTDLTSVADAIRTKGGTSGQLQFPSGFVDAIDAIETGGGGFSAEEIFSGLQPSGTVDVTMAHNIPDRGCCFRSQLAHLTLRMGDHTIGSSGVSDNANLLSVKIIWPNTFNRALATYTVSRNVKMKTLVIAGKILSSNQSFRDNSVVEAVDIDQCGSIANNSFLNNRSMATLIIRSTTLTTLSTTGAFGSTPFASGGAGGTLYVPASLVSQYTQATNWSTILGYANNQILPIEGSIYETQYADGTPIPTT